MSVGNKQRISVLTTWIRQLPTVNHSDAANGSASVNGSANGSAHMSTEISPESDGPAQEGQAAGVVADTDEADGDRADARRPGRPVRDKADGYADPTGFTIGQCW